MVTQFIRKNIDTKNFYLDPLSLCNSSSSSSSSSSKKSLQENGYASSDLQSSWAREALYAAVHLQNSYSEMPPHSELPRPQRR